MATLEEILARLPDNSTGAIDADDIRFAVNELWNRIEAVANAATVEAQGAKDYAVGVNARLDALEEAGGAGRTAGGVYRLDTNPANTPGNGEVVSNTGALESATQLAFSALTRSGTDLSHALAQVETIEIQDQSDASRWVTYTVSGAIVPTANTFVVPVTVTDSQGSIPGGNNDLVVLLGWTV